MSEYHIPVLARKAVELLDVRPGGIYADLTFGGGGHSRIILSQLGADGKLYGFDQDVDALANAPDDSRFEFIHGNFRFMRSLLRERGVEKLDGVLADLGVSSHHFDDAGRGFSFRGDAPLDMRMNRGARLTAAKIIAEYPEDELARILRDWGEVEHSGRVAGCIEKARTAAPITTTGELVKAVEACTPPKDPSKFLSKLFQALRIEVNGELEALRMALSQSLKMLVPGGRLTVISYHSLEDRLVKNFMRSGNFEGRIEKDFYGRIEAPAEPVVRKAIVPDESELAANPRSRSARLRAARKL